MLLKVKSILNKCQVFFSSSGWEGAALEQSLINKKNLKKNIIFFLILWFSLFLIFPSTVNKNKKHKRGDATGFIHNSASKFFYFNYFLDQYPLYSKKPIKDFSEEGARKLLSESGPDLLMEYGYWTRLGEHFRNNLYFFKSFFTRSAENPSIIPFNIFIFFITLVGLYYAFARNGKPLLGLILVVLFGSSPFLRHEIFLRENVFGLMVLISLQILIINVKFVFNKKVNSYLIFLLPVLTGVLIGIGDQIRTESKILIFSAIFIYLFAGNTKIRNRLFMILLVCYSYIFTHNYIQNYYQLKIQKAKKTLVKYNGTSYTGPIIPSHNLWHPLACGLGDHDSKYGFEWKDLWSYKLFLPKYNQKYGTNYQMNKGYILNDYYNNEPFYPKKPELLPGYEEIVKEYTLNKIKSDPLWYGSIMIKRVWTILWNTSPVRMSVSIFDLPIPFNGLLALFIFIIFVLNKLWVPAKLIFYTLPFTATPLIIYSGRNSTYLTSYHIFAFGIILYMILNHLLKGLEDE